MEEEKIVAVWDADFIPFYVCHNKKGTEDKTIYDCLRLSDELITNINNHIGADYFCGFLTKGKCFRYDINPSYKANRKYTNLPKYINEVKEYVENTYNFTSKPGYEADDLVMSFEAQNSQFKSVLVSPDKDILGIGKNVYNPRLNKPSTNTVIGAELNFWSSMVTGDTIDGIKGIPGKGKAYFKNVIIKTYCNNTNATIRDVVFDEYIKYFGEYEGIKEFTKNYLSLKIVDNVDVSEIIRLNKVEKPSIIGEISKFND